jgi:putative hydrolase of the HAD superfamily
MEFLNIKMVVMDAMGVIYVARDDVKELLIPFLRQKDCTISDKNIYKLYQECSLGRFSSSEFWHRMQVKDSVRYLDDEYVQGMN